MSVSQPLLLRRWLSGPTNPVSSRCTTVPPSSPGISAHSVSRTSSASCVRDARLRRPPPREIDRRLDALDPHREPALRRPGEPALVAGPDLDRLGARPPGAELRGVTERLPHAFRRRAEAPRPADAVLPVRVREELDQLAELVQPALDVAPSGGIAARSRSRAGGAGCRRGRRLEPALDDGSGRIEAGFPRRRPAPRERVARLDRLEPDKRPGMAVPLHPADVPDLARQVDAAPAGNHAASSVRFGQGLHRPGPARRQGRARARWRRSFRSMVSVTSRPPRGGGGARPGARPRPRHMRRSQSSTVLSGAGVQLMNPLAPFARGPDQAGARRSRGASSPPAGSSAGPRSGR